MLNEKNCGPVHVLVSQRQKPRRREQDGYAFGCFKISDESYGFVCGHRQECVDGAAVALCALTAFVCGPGSLTSCERKSGEE
jgi:hypothetical protein